MNPCLSGAACGTNLFVDCEGIRKWKWYLAPAQTSTSSVFNGKRFQYSFSVKLECYNTYLSFFIGGAIAGNNRDFNMLFLYLPLIIFGINVRLSFIIYQAY